jgi:hypothetical protein
MRERNQDSRILIIPILLALALIPAAPQPAPKAPFVWQDADKPLPPSPSRSAKGSFAAMMLVTPDADAFIAEWLKPENPSVSTTERIARDRPVFAMLIVAGCRAGTDGNCRVGAEFRMKRPDGAPYGPVHRAVALNGPPAPEGNLQLSQASLGFKLDPPDPLGRYTITATVTDEIAGEALIVEQIVEAVQPKKKP